MGWRNRLLPASFRDVTFDVKRADTQIGRRTALHEYPQKDDAWPEDMGRLARRFTVEAFIVGEFYDQYRDALIEALEQPGPGELVHPYYGRRQVSLASPVRISESAVEEGGIARFSIEFVEAGDNTQPAARIDTRAAVYGACDAAHSAASKEFELGFAVGAKASFVADSALAKVNDVVRELHAVRHAMIPDVSVLTAWVGAGKALSGGAAALLRAPVDLAASVQGLVAGVRGMAIAPAAALVGLRRLFDFGNAEAAARPIPRSTPSRIAQADNALAVNRLMQRAAVVEAVHASADVTFASRDEALALRDELGERIDLLADDADEAVYRALVALRVALVRDITTRGADLARIDHATLARTLPALVVAHRVYGDAARGDEIVARNRARVRHPGFVPGGVALEILRD